MKPDESKLRTLKKQTQDNSAIINRIVDSIVGKYVSDLNGHVDKIKELIDSHETLTDEEIEDIVIRIPIYIYYAAEGLEVLGVEGDNAKAIKLEAFNTFFMEEEGTIQDKTKASELKTFSEDMMEVAYVRAYKKLKIQIEKAEHIFSGAKKVLDKRMKEIDLNIRDRYYGEKSGGKYIGERMDD